MDLRTKDQRAWDLAPRLTIAPESIDVVSWVNPATGTVCRLERTGDYEIWHKVHMVMQAAVVSRLPQDEAEQLLRNPWSEGARRAAAQAILAVDATTE
jgi:hypothetical protein